MDLSKVTLEIFTKLEQKWLSHCETAKKTRVLSIDGGGTTGIVAGASLIHLEEQIRLVTGDPNARIADFFDIVAGTGIGALLASMLLADDGSGHPLFTAREAIDLVASRNSKLFCVRFLRVLRRKCRFSRKGMDKVLKEIFLRDDGEVLTLKDMCKSLLVPCYDLKSSSPFIFFRADRRSHQASTSSPEWFKSIYILLSDRRFSISPVGESRSRSNSGSFLFKFFKFF